MFSSGISQLAIDGEAKETLRDLVGSWHNHKGPVLFVGAGMSAFQGERRQDAPASARFSTWEMLLAPMRERLSGGDAEAARRLSDPLRVAELFVNAVGRRGLQDLISKHVPSECFNPGAAHERLRELPWAAVVTGNYDDLLERTFPPLRPICRIVKDQDLTAPRTVDHLEIVKMHGDLSQPDSIVLTEDDYRKYEASRPGVALKVKQLLVEHPLLFLGFGLTDPNFTRIDGWVQDTVREFRLPAVAVVHSSPTASERSMWTGRGIKLVHLPHEVPMVELIGALAHEHRRLLRLASEPPGFNQRVHDLEKQIHDSVKAVATGTPASEAIASVASLLGQILDGAASDPDSGEAALQVVRWLAWGWHSVLYPLLDHSESAARPKPLLPLRDIFDALLPARKQRLLMMTLEAGMSTIHFDSTTTHDVVDDIMGRPLAPDDRSLALLHLAQIHRDRGELAAADEGLRKARANAASPDMHVRITAEMLDLLFLAGDAERIRQELQRPPDRAVGVFAICRRASGYLLLGQRENAQQWYQEALRLAVSGDERYVAMYGAAVASIVHPHDPTPESEELFRRMREIRADERPLTIAAERLRDGAGRKLLDGKREEAVAALQRYLSELRRLGWPQSSSHGMNTEIEVAARRAARLGLLDSGGERPEAIKEALTLLNTYGPAGDISSLLEVRHLDALGRDTSSIAWFRDLTKVTPTLPAQREARITTAMRGLPLLDDDDLTRRIYDLITQVDDWMSKDGEQSLLSTWWKEAQRYAEHLPRAAAVRLLDASVRYASAAYPARVFAPGGVSNALGLWRKLGYVGPEAATAIAQMAEQVFGNPAAETDSSWLGAAISLVGEAAAESVLVGPDMTRALSAADVRLGQMLAAGGNRNRHTTIELGVLVLGSPQPSAHNAALADRAKEFVRMDLRSSALGETLYLMELVLPWVSSPDRDAIVNMLIDEAGRVTTTDYGDLFERGALAHGLSVLAGALPDHRDQVLSVVQRLVALDPGVYGPAVKLDGLWPAGDSAASAMVLSLLPIVGPRRPRILRSAARWLRDNPAVPTVAPAIDMLIGVLIADLPETRIGAVHAIKAAFRFARDDPHVDLRERAFTVLLELATRDASWRVRASAIVALAGLCRNSVEVNTVQPVVDAARTADIAILRRVAELAIVELGTVPVVAG